MDWFLLVHYSDGGDSAGKNAYLYNDPLTPDYFSMTPWDFNHAWGQNWRTYRIGSGALNSFDNRNRIFQAIHEIPASDDELWARFTSMRTDGPYALSWMHGKLDEYYALIDESAARDWVLWGDAYNGFGRWASTLDHGFLWKGCIFQQVLNSAPRCGPCVPFGRWAFTHDHGYSCCLLQTQ